LLGLALWEDVFVKKFIITNGLPPMVGLLLLSECFSPDTEKGRASFLLHVSDIFPFLDIFPPNIDQIQTAAMNILDHLPLPRRLPARADIFAQATTHTTTVTDLLYFQNFFIFR